MIWYWIVAIILAFVIIKFLTGLLLKVALFLLLLGTGLYALFHYGIWPFEKKIETLQAMESKFCPSDPLTCNCIVQKLKQDLNNRFSREELEALDKSNLKFQYAIQKSTQARRNEILTCLGEQNHHKLAEFRNIVLGAEWLKAKPELDSEKHIENAKNRIREVLDSKEEIDRKY